MYEIRNWTNKSGLKNMVREAKRLAGDGILDNTGYFTLMEILKDSEEVGNLAIDISKTDNAKEKHFSVYVDTDEGIFRNPKYPNGFYGTESLEPKELYRLLDRIVKSFVKTVRDEYKDAVIWQNA